MLYRTADGEFVYKNGLSDGDVLGDLSNIEYCFHITGCFYKVMHVHANMIAYLMQW